MAVALSPGPVGAAAAPAAAPVAGAADWPMFAHDVHHTGRSPETGLGTSNVASLGLQWQANTGAATYNSPAIVYNSSLDKTLVYTASKSKVVAAYDAASGARIWTYRANAAIVSSPAVVNNVVYIGSDDYHLRALNASTGQLICSFNTGGIISASPVVADPGGGRVVYVGDNGTGGGNDGGHIWAINAVDPNPAANCSLKWKYDQFGEPPGSQPSSGSWSPPAFATTATGRELVVVGASSPDNSAYALDAATGDRVWRFQTRTRYLDQDVGAGPTISPPGANGFPDGVAYVIGKSHIVYALNLATGAKLWEFDINIDSPNFNGTTRSTPALVGNRLYLGYGEGVYALNAVTGAKIWKFTNPSRTEVVSSPAVTGPQGSQVVFVGDMSGRVHALDAGTGAALWNYDTGGFIYGSAAVWNGTVFIGSSDSFLYAFRVGGTGSSAKPTVAISSPANGVTLANPNGNLTITGTASDDQSVASVRLAVKDATRNKWWDAATGTWGTQFTTNPATLGSPDSQSTNWQFSVPINPAGGNYTIQAEAVDNEGQHTTPVALTRVSVLSTGNPPDTTISAPKNKQVIHLPDPATSIPITVEGTATDSGGSNIGVQNIRVVIQNTEHGEYYCGAAGCPGSPNVMWRTTFTRLTVAPANPGAATTTWTVTFPSYDHPHNYSVTAQAVDRDGEMDPSKARVSPICVRRPGEGCAGSIG